MKEKITEGLGWYGVLAILAAYALLNLGLISLNNLWYQLLNLTGAIAVAVDALEDKDYQPIVLNVIWAIVALIAIVRLFF